MKDDHNVVLAEDMPMVDEAYMDMFEQDFAEDISWNELHPSLRFYNLSTRPIICKCAATSTSQIVRNSS